MHLIRCSPGDTGTTLTGHTGYVIRTHPGPHAVLLPGGKPAALSDPTLVMRVKAD